MSKALAAVIMICTQKLATFWVHIIIGPVFYCFFVVSARTARVLELAFARGGSFPISLDLFVLTYGQIEGCVFSRIKSAHRALFLIYKQYFISIRVYLIEKASFLQTRLFHNRVVHKKMKAMNFLFFGINRHSYPMVFYQYFFWQTRKLYSDKKISCRS